MLFFRVLLIASLMLAYAHGNGTAEEPGQSSDARIEVPNHIPVVAFSFSVVEGCSELVIKSDKPLDQVTSFVLDSPPRFVLDIKEATMDKEVMSIPVSRPELRTIRIARHKEKVRFVFDFPMEKTISHRLDKLPDGLKVVIGSVEKNPTKDAEKEREVVQVKGSTPIEARPYLEKPNENKSPETQPTVDKEKESISTEVQPSPAINTILEPQAKVMDKQYTGQKVTIRLHKAQLREFFDLITSYSGIPIELAPQIHEGITLKLVDIPWDQALDIVVDFYGLKVERLADRLRIVPAEPKQEDRQ